MITINTLPQATQQQVFDQIALHMLTQNERSTADKGGCAYRGTGGLMCAAGCLISDDEYTPEMDTQNMTWAMIVDDGLATSDHFELISSLQHLHDERLPIYWRASLRRIAVGHELSMDVIENFPM